MNRIQIPGHYKPTTKGHSERVLSSHARKKNLRIVMEHFKDGDSIVSILDNNTGLFEKFLFDSDTELINGTILNHTIYTMLNRCLKSHGITSTRYNTEMVILRREYPEATEKDRHEICIQLLTTATATA